MCQSQVWFHNKLQLSHQRLHTAWINLKPNFWGFLVIKLAWFKSVTWWLFNIFSGIQHVLFSRLFIFCLPTVITFEHYEGTCLHSFQNIFFLNIYWFLHFPLSFFNSFLLIFFFFTSFIANQMLLFLLSSCPERWNITHPVGC